MKAAKQIVFLLVILSTGLSFSQKKESRFFEEKTVYVSNVKMTVYHNRHDLEKLKKHTLMHIQQKRMRLFLEMLPYIALKCKPGQDVLKMDNLPMNKKRVKRAEKQQKERIRFFTQQEENTSKVLNFADTKDLIDQIIFLDNAIGEMRAFLDLK